MSQNLVPGGWDRRTIQSLEESGNMGYIDLDDIYVLLHKKVYPYKTRHNFYEIRDRALGGLIVMTCGRINEVLRIIKSQFKEMRETDKYKNEADPDILMLLQFYVSKRKAGKRHPTPDIPLFRVGPLAKFTKLIEDYLNILEGNDTKLFQFGTSHAWEIINTITGGGRGQTNKGKFPHWFRAQSLSYNVNKLRSATMVAKQKGIDNPSTIAHYYTGEWQVTKEEMKK